MVTSVAFKGWVGLVNSLCDNMVRTAGDTGIARGLVLCLRRDVAVLGRPLEIMASFLGETDEVEAWGYPDQRISYAFLTSANDLLNFSRQGDASVLGEYLIQTTSLLA